MNWWYIPIDMTWLIIMLIFVFCYRTSLITENLKLYIFLLFMGLMGEFAFEDISKNKVR